MTLQHVLEQKLEATKGDSETIRFNGDDTEFSREVVSLAAWWRGSGSVPGPGLGDSARAQLRDGG